MPFLKNKILSNGIITLFLRLLGVVTLFGFTIFLTRNYSPNIVGQYDFTRTILLLVGSICLLGTDQSILFFSGELKATQSFGAIKHLYFKTIAILLIISVSFLLIFLFIPKVFINNFFGDSSTYFIILNSISILFFYILSIYNTEFIRALGYIYTSEIYRNTIKYIPVFIGALYLLDSTNQLFLPYFYIYGFIPLGIITSVSIFIKLKRIDHKKEISKYTKKEIINKSYPMGISSIIFFIFLSFDIFLLKKYFGNEVVAFYSISIKLITFMSMVILAIGINASTKISEYFTRNDWDNLKKLVKKSNQLIFVINLIATFFLIFFSTTILSIFGKEYAQANYILIILTLSQLAASFFGIIPIYMNMTNKGKAFKNILLFSLLIYLTLNTILIPLYGIYGAAITYSITNIIWPFLSFIYVKKKDKINISIY